MICCTVVLFTFNGVIGRCTTFYFNNLRLKSKYFGGFRAVFSNCCLKGARCAVPRLAGDLDKKLRGAATNQRIHRAHNLSQMYGCSSRVSAANLAVEVAKINAFGQRLGALAFDVLADVVLAGVQQACGLFAFDG